MSPFWVKTSIILVGILFGIIFPILYYFSVRYEETMGKRLKKLKILMPFGWLLILIWLVNLILYKA
jgi:uncharacterized membrane-anchored protein